MVDGLVGRKRRLRATTFNKNFQQQRTKTRQTRSQTQTRQTNKLTFDVRKATSETLVSLHGLLRLSLVGFLLSSLYRSLTRKRERGSCRNKFGIGSTAYLSNFTPYVEFDGCRPTSNASKEERWDRVGYLRHTVRTSNKHLPASLQNNAMNTLVSVSDWTGSDGKSTETGKRAGSVDRCHVTNQA